MASTISTTLPLPLEDKPAIRGRKSGSNENRFIAQKFYSHQKIIHYMLIYMLIFSFGVQAAVTQLTHGCKSLWIDSDGNSVDPDDFGASHMALILLKAAGADSLLAGLTYNNQFRKKDPGMVLAMIEAHRRAAGLGYNTKNWFDVSEPTGRTAGTIALKNAIIAATAANKLCIIGGGPYQLMYDAFKLASSSVTDFSNVIVVTHSWWNMFLSDTSPRKNNMNNKNKTNLMADFPTIEHVLIFDQNTAFGNDMRLNPLGSDKNVATNYVGVKRFDYLLKYSTENPVSFAVNNAYQTIQDMFTFKTLNKFGYGDISDVGVTMYLLTGKENTTLSELQEIIECGIKPDGTLANPNKCISPPLVAPPPVLTPAPPATLPGLGNLVLVKNPNTVGAQVYQITSSDVTYKIPSGTSFTIGFETGSAYASPYDGVKMFLEHPIASKNSPVIATEGTAPLCISSDAGSGTVSDCYPLVGDFIEGTYTVKHKLRRGDLFDRTVSFTFIVSKTTGK